MIRIGEVALTLPAGFGQRADAIARLLADELARLPAHALADTDRVVAATVAATLGDSDRAVAAAAAHAVATALPRRARTQGA